MQEQFQYISSGKIPQTIVVIIEGDFENGNTFRPGDDLTITGLLTYRYNTKLRKDAVLPLQLVIYSNTIVVQKANKSNFNDELS